MYVWLKGPVAVADLPEFTADHLAELEEVLETIGWDRTGGRKARVARAPAAGDPMDPDDFFTETKTAALANMEAWVHDLDVFDLRPARGGYEAVATWRASSTGKPIAERKRNLSIQANGIKDFGTHWTGSAIDLVMEAQNLEQAPATTWLRMRLGLTADLIVLEQRPAALAVEVYAPSAFTPSLPAVIRPHPDQMSPMTVGPEAFLAESEPLADNEPRADLTTELPDHLTRVPGLLGLITDWIADTARRPQRGLSLGAALTLVGTAAGRKVEGPTHSATHLYVLGIARTSAGKDHPLNCISRIMQASAMGAHEGPSQYMSMSAMINRLTRQPLTLSAIDEFGSFLARVNGKRSSTHERGITGIMRSVWGKSFGTMPPPEWAGRSSTPIHSPALSIYGVSTPEEFYAAIEGTDVFNGFLNRFMTISTKLRPAEREPKIDAFTVPEAISNGMVGIYSIGGTLLGASMHGTGASPPEMTVPWDDAQAEAVYARFGREIERREADMAFLARAAEMSVRMATIRAIGINKSAPRITVEDMEWGRDLARWSAERMMEDAADYMSENDHQASAQKIIRTLKIRGKMKHSDLLRSLQNTMKARDVKDIMQSLADSGQILIETTRPPAGGPGVAHYTLIG